LPSNVTYAAERRSAEVARQHLPNDIADRPEGGLQSAPRRLVPGWVGRHGVASAHRAILVRRHHIRPGGGGLLDTWAGAPTEGRCHRTAFEQARYRTTLDRQAGNRKARRRT